MHTGKNNGDDDNNNNNNTTVIWRMGHALINVLNRVLSVGCKLTLPTHVRH